MPHTPNGRRLEQVERNLQLLGILSTLRQGLSLNEVVEELKERAGVEVSTRTAYRDLEMLSNLNLTESIKVAGRRRYRLTKTNLSKSLAALRGTE